jgi:hypothetical protein
LFHQIASISKSANKQLQHVDNLLPYCIIPEQQLLCVPDVNTILSEVAKSLRTKKRSVSTGNFHAAGGATKAAKAPKSIQAVQTLSEDESVYEDGDDA